LFGLPCSFVAHEAQTNTKLWKPALEEQKAPESLS
jgi:hypothetical protein